MLNTRFNYFNPLDGDVRLPVLAASSRTDDEVTGTVPTEVADRFMAGLMTSIKCTFTTTFSAGGFPRFIASVVVGFIAIIGLSTPAQAQQGIPFPPENTVLAGIGGLPGVGAMVGYVSPKRMYTREAVVYGVVIPSIRGRDGSAYIAVVIGGALRIIGTGETLGFIPPKKYDIDIGIRLGPALVFEFDESRADKNKRFNVAAEPFLRFARKLGKSQRTLYVEGGLIRPSLRLGIWFGI